MARVYSQTSDSGMDGGPPARTLAAADLATVTDAVAAVIDAVTPSVVITLDPGHGDGHRDHVSIGAATTAACAIRPGIPLQYWALPRPLLQHWFDELARVRPGSGHLDLDHAGLGRTEAEITHALDVSAYRDQP